MTILVDRERRASGVSCRAGRYFWHTIKLDDRVCASAPRNSYPRALGRLNHQLRAKFILEDLYPNTRPKKKSRRSSGGVPQPPPTGGDASDSSESD